ncbi:MAG: enoyl-CoA hydratase/isomerase family protein [Proteobacteria bacterium]|nr:enoyl-CoA hydratase/isomerase family protein [Desulfobacula sp.]MBU3951263.1 enoyl-CoA hydratase/isomerase family protein [Pseudomonadota bacterium]
METAPILYEKSDKIAIITLNRPENRNSMDPETMPAFHKILEQVRQDSKLRCLIIAGSGTSFCTGADFKSGIIKKGQPFLNKVLMALYKPFLDIGKLQIPVIGAINGHAIGGDLGLALMCDIRIADSKARMGANFARLGVHSGMAISYILPRLVGLAKANELLFTGRLITGEEAASIGLVNYAVENEKVMEKSLALAHEIALCAPAAVQMMKHSIYSGLDWNPLKSAEMEAHIQSRTFEMEDAQEGICAMLEKREPDFQGK